MTVFYEKLEAILSDPNRVELHPTAYAALTLTRLLASEWTHMVVTKVKKGPDIHERVSKPAGQTVGGREGLQCRLNVLLAALG